jgi:hypothetical protein
MRTPGEMGAAGTVLAARLFFEDNSLRETALKLARLRALPRSNESCANAITRLVGGFL